MANDIEARLDDLTGRYSPPVLRESRQSILLDVFSAIVANLCLTSILTLPFIAATLSADGQIAIPTAGSVLAVAANRIRAFRSLKNARLRFRKRLAGIFFGKASSAWIYDAFEILNQIRELSLSGMVFADEHLGIYGGFQVALRIQPGYEHVLYSVAFNHRGTNGELPKVCHGQIKTYFNDDGAEPADAWEPHVEPDIDDETLALAGRAVIAALNDALNGAQARREMALKDISSARYQALEKAHDLPLPSIDSIAWAPASRETRVNLDRLSHMLEGLFDPSAPKTSLQHSIDMLRERLSTNPQLFPAVEGYLDYALPRMLRIASTAFNTKAAGDDGKGARLSMAESLHALEAAGEVLAPMLKALDAEAALAIRDQAETMRAPLGQDSVG